MKGVFRILLVLVTLAFTACGVSPSSCCGESLSSEEISVCQIVTSDCETVSVLKSTDEDRHFYEDLTTMCLSQAENVFLVVILRSCMEASYQHIRYNA